MKTTTAKKHSSLGAFAQAIGYENLGRKAEVATADKAAAKRVEETLKRIRRGK